MQIGTIGPNGKGMKRSTLWVRRSGLHEDEDRCGGLVEGSVSTLGSSGFSGSLKLCTEYDFYRSVCLFVCLCVAELYLNSCKFDSAYACIQEAASYNPVSHAVSYLVSMKMIDIVVVYIVNTTSIADNVEIMQF